MRYDAKVSISLNRNRRDPRFQLCRCRFCLRGIPAIATRGGARIRQPSVNDTVAVVAAAVAALVAVLPAEYLASRRRPPLSSPGSSSSPSQAHLGIDNACIEQQLCGVAVIWRKKAEIQGWRVSLSCGGLGEFSSLGRVSSALAMTAPSSPWQHQLMA